MPNDRIIEGLLAAHWPPPLIRQALARDASAAARTGSGMVVPCQVLAYVLACRDRGLSDAEISSKLLATGWSRPLIDRALKEASGSP